MKLSDASAIDARVRDAAEPIAHENVRSTRRHDWRVCEHRLAPLDHDAIAGADNAVFVDGQLLKGRCEPRYPSIAIHSGSIWITHVPTLQESARLLRRKPVRENFRVNGDWAPLVGAGDFERREGRQRWFGATRAVVEEGEQRLRFGRLGMLTGREIRERHRLAKLTGLQRRAHEAQLRFERFALLGQRLV
jgi:hypothetical protein